MGENHFFTSLFQWGDYFKVTSMLSSLSTLHTRAGLGINT